MISCSRADRTSSTPARVVAADITNAADVGHGSTTPSSRSSSPVATPLPDVDGDDGAPSAADEPYAIDNDIIDYDFEPEPMLHDHGDYAITASLDGNVVAAGELVLEEGAAPPPHLMQAASASAITFTPSAPASLLPPAPPQAEAILAPPSLSDSTGLPQPAMSAISLSSPMARLAPPPPPAPSPPMASLTPPRDRDWAYYPGFNTAASFAQDASSFDVASQMAGLSNLRDAAHSQSSHPAPTTTWTAWLTTDGLLPPMNYPDQTSGYVTEVGLDGQQLLDFFNDPSNGFF